MLLWMQKHHANIVEDLIVQYNVSDEYSIYASFFLSTLSQFQNLKRLELFVDDAAIDLPSLGNTLLKMSNLESLSLGLSMRTDTVHPITLTTIWKVAVRMRTLKMAMRMSDIKDAVIAGLLDVCRTTPPAWEDLHLSLKHNLLSDAAASYLAAVVRLCKGLRNLHLNMSYNPVTARGRHLLGGLCAMRHCVLKLDSDLREMAPFVMAPREGDSVRLCMSSAYNAIGIPENLFLGRTLRHLDLDLEGCRLHSNSALPRLADALSRMGGTLRFLSLGLADVGLLDSAFGVLCERGIANLRGLHTLGMHVASNRLSDTAISTLLGALSREVRHVELDVGDNMDLRNIALAGLNQVHTLHLQAGPGVIDALTLPSQLKRLSLSLIDATVTCKITLPASLRSLELNLLACNFSPESGFLGIRNRLTQLVDNQWLSHVSNVTASVSIQVDVTQTASSAARALLWALSMSGASGLRRLCVVTSDSSLMRPLLMMLRTFHQLRTISLDVNVLSGSDIGGLLGSLSEWRELTYVCMQLRGPAKVGAAFCARHLRYPTRLHLNVSELALGDSGLTELAKCVVDRAERGLWTVMTVSGADVGIDSLRELTRAAGMPRCRVHVYPSGRSPFETEALRLSTGFF